ncbi:IS3 family transposase [Streptomyces sp. NPDC091376]|uniref:IS3 family transposase n=1 Tax=Streptomyces sp. NPDC091376 TaxID=3365994 RepID=UPI0037F904FE
MLKVEYVHRHTFSTRTEARIRIATWITDSYNSRRLHSVCGFTSPGRPNTTTGPAPPRSWLHRKVSTVRGD